MSYHGTHFLNEGNTHLLRGSIATLNIGKALTKGSPLEYAHSLVEPMKLFSHEGESELLLSKIKSNLFIHPYNIFSQQFDRKEAPDKGSPQENTLVLSWNQ